MLDPVTAAADTTSGLKLQHLKFPVLKFNQVIILKNNITINLKCV